MVDVYHLYKICISTAKVLKASKGAYSAAMIFRHVRKPLATMGALGFIDGAVEDAFDKLLKEITKEKENGCSR